MRIDDDLGDPDDREDVRLDDMPGQEILRRALMDLRNAKHAENEALKAVPEIIRKYMGAPASDSRAAVGGSQMHEISPPC